LKRVQAEGVSAGNVGPVASPALPEEFLQHAV
jgi:hypothetical protein